MSTEPEPGLAPEHTKPRQVGEPVTMSVDGQDFRISERAGKPGEYDFDWLNGPPGYGFGLSGPGASGMTPPEMAEAIRAFLADIDPATGYLRK